ncbi:MAG: type II toxin-antitoxin system RelE/ParE family toxin [Desulfuromonadaceae bacterium]|nr:type II toxin-antitoxin system RelE/ParE family toxin [Desulfuromonas sp.]MDY0184858.1 type II toxin-antitoxin system RelE/ParE family toxin [Desulfuromonadaceae bacterium]
MLKVVQTRTFAKYKKKLHQNQLNELDAAIQKILQNPESGEPKKGDLLGVYVYKCKITKQLFQIAYQFDESTLTLLMLAQHENFYRGVKKIV